MRVPDLPLSRGRRWAALLLAIGAAACMLVIARELDARESVAHMERLGPLRYTRGVNSLVLGVLCVGTALALLYRGLRMRPAGQGGAAEGPGRVGRPARIALAGWCKRHWARPTAPWAAFGHPSPLRKHACLLGPRTPSATPNHSTAHPKPFFTGLLVVALSVGGLAYFYGGRGIGWNYYAGLWDALHYGVGAKYHAELGYYDLYECVAQADAEMGRVLPGGLMLRDLHSYELVPAAGSRERVDCRARFDQARWAGFKADLKPLLLYGRGIMAEALRDHGYNGTPLRSLIAGGLVPLPELSFRNLTLLTLIDVVAISLMLAGVAVSFGRRIGVLFALFVFVGFSDRYEHIGGSQLRYLWLVALVAGLCLLRRGRHAGAAAALTISALLNVFPAVFLVGPLLRALRSRLCDGRLTGEQRRFVTSVALTGGGLLGLTLLQPGGLQRHLDFAHKMLLHAQVDNNARVGLRYLFAPVTDMPTEALSSTASAAPTPLAFVIVAALVLGFALPRIARLDDVEASALGGMLLLFVSLGTVQYYYACACVLVLLLHRRIERRSGVLLAALLFGSQAGVYVLWAAGVPMPACDHVASSVAYAFFLGVALLCFGGRASAAAVPASGAPVAERATRAGSPAPGCAV